MESTLSYRSHRGQQLEMAESTNSFLVETSYNSGINERLREDIEYKYHKSKVNSLYKFPRLTKKQPVIKKKFSTKSFENLKKRTQVYRSAKSLLNLCVSEKRSLEPQLKKFSGSQKNLKIVKKKECVHVRIYSTRNLPKDKSPDSKSPPQKKQIVGVYSKTPSQFCNPGISKMLNSMRPVKMEGGLTNRMHSMRLRRIFNNSRDGINVCK